MSKSNMSSRKSGKEQFEQDEEFARPLLRESEGRNLRHEHRPTSTFQHATWILLAVSWITTFAFALISIKLLYSRAGLLDEWVVPNDGFWNVYEHGKAPSNHLYDTLAGLTVMQRVSDESSPNHHSDTCGSPEP